MKLDSVHIKNDAYRLIFSGGSESQRGVRLILDTCGGDAVKENEAVNDRPLL